MPSSYITNLDDPEVIAKNYGNSYGDRKVDCESPVTLWRWASNVMYDPRPFGAFLRRGPGRWLRQKKKGNMPYEYGFGQPGEILVERIYMGHHYREQFFYYSPERIVSFSYPYDWKQLAWVCVTRFTDGRPTSHSRYSGDDGIGRLEEQYHYLDGLVRRRECREVRHGMPRQYSFKFTYDEEGKLIRIESENPGGSVIYKKR